MKGCELYQNTIYLILLSISEGRLVLPRELASAMAQNYETIVLETPWAKYKTDLGFLGVNSTLVCCTSLNMRARVSSSHWLTHRDCVSFPKRRSDRLQAISCSNTTMLQNLHV